MRSSRTFVPCRADPDISMHPSKKSGGSPIWEYVLLYTDDCLVISKNGESDLWNETGKYFELKGESIGRPDIYLGGKLREVKLEKGLHVLGVLNCHNTSKLPTRTSKTT